MVMLQIADLSIPTQGVSYSARERLGLRLDKMPRNPHIRTRVTRLPKSQDPK
jgi:hypothetical protein